MWMAATWGTRRRKRSWTKDMGGWEGPNKMGGKEAVDQGESKKGVEFSPSVESASSCCQPRSQAPTPHANASLPCKSFHGDPILLAGA